MHPILFKAGPITVYSYGLMVAVGFSLAVYLASLNASSYGIKKENVIDVALCILITGLVGARLLYVLINIDHYRARPIEIFYISQGGLVYYGAFLFGLLGAAVCVLRKRLSFWSMSDLLAPYIALGQSIGRIGCFLNGCCYGRPALFGVSFPHDDLPRHPTQVYSSLLLLMLFITLKSMEKRRTFPGEIFLSYCALYAVQRFFVEFFRGDNPAVFFNMTISQAASVILLAASLLTYTVFSLRCRNTHFR